MQNNVLYKEWFVTLSRKYIFKRETIRQKENYKQKEKKKSIARRTCYESIPNKIKSGLIKSTAKYLMGTLSYL